MISIIAKRLKINDKQIQKMQTELENESWLYSQTKWKKIAACYLYSLVGHAAITLPVVSLVYYFFFM